MALRFRHLALASVLLVGPAATAHAQDADPTHAAAARALFAEGVTASDAGDWATAAERFRRARALRSSPTIALNLAVALTHLGQLVEATELLRAVLRDPSSTDALRASANTTLAELEPRFAWVQLQTEGSLEGITIEANGHPLAPELVGTSVPLDPGHHRFTARRGEEVVASAELDLAEGERAPVALVIPPPPPVDETVEEVEPVEPIRPVGPTDGGPDPVAIGLGVGAGVLVVGGVVALVLVLTLPGEPSPFVGNAGVLEIGR